MPLQFLIGIRDFKNQLLAKAEEREKLKSLGKGQTPDALCITCCDSRLSPASFTKSDLGVMFLGRNPGNIVAPFPDPSEPSGGASTIEFALKKLECKEVIVCGHSDCGAMKGLLATDLEETLPHTAAWISHARLVIKYVKKHHPDVVLDSPLGIELLARANVILQMKNLETHEAVAEQLAAGTLKIRGWYYEINSGAVHIYNPQKKAFVSFEQAVEEVATEKLHQVVEEEALKYLISISTPKSVEDYLALVRLYHTVRFIDVSDIWEHIKTEVRTRLHTEIGGLYATIDGGVSDAFDTLIEKGPLIQLENAGAVYQAIISSQWRSTAGSAHKFHRDAPSPLETGTVPEPIRARL